MDAHSNPRRALKSVQAGAGDGAEMKETELDVL